MVVEYKLGPVERSQHESDRPEDVRRVASLNDIEPARSPRLDGEQCSRSEGVDVLGDEADIAATRRVWTVFVKLHAFNDIVSRIAIRFRTYDAD